MNTRGNERFLRVTANYLRTSSRTFPRNTIVYPKNGGAVFTNKRRLLIQDSVVDLNTGGFLPSSKLSVAYLFYFFCTIDFNKCSKGSALPTIDAHKLFNMLIPLPPLAEQERIVAKLEDCLALCEAYEERERLDLDFGAAMRKSLLQAAIQGKLVPQDPADGNAADLLAAIRVERTRLIKEKKLRKPKPLPPIAPDEIPFSIPASWQWVRLREVTHLIGGKEHQIFANEVLRKGKYPAVSQGANLIDGYCDYEEKLIRDVPVVLFGDHTRHVKYLDFPFVVSADGVKLLKPEQTSAKYLYYWALITAQSLRDRGYARHFALLNEKPIPLPPLAEQERIVAKLEELLPLCTSQA